jgi:folate-binding protein YgfZ
VSNSPAPPASTTALRLAGRDVLDLLHRVSTQSLADLPRGASRATLFCDFRGRLLHRAIVAHAADDSVWLLRDDASGDGLAAYLDRLTFREDVKMEDLGASLDVRGILGTSLPPGALLESAGRPTRVGLAGGLAFEVVDASLPPSPEARDAWERARIRAGWPRHGHEIAEAFHPYEVGCAGDVHLQKGCYTGQEVLMRLVTYDSVRRLLARTSGPGAAPSVPSELRLAAEPAGVLTSAVADGDGWIGLAVLKHAAFEPETALIFADGSRVEKIEAFPETRPAGLP